MNVSDLLNQPESKTLEFKQDISSLKPIIKTVVAFANTAGGVLIIGYSQEKKLLGIRDVLQAEESLVSAIADSITPSMHLDVDIKSIEGHDLLIVRVAHQKGPYYVTTEGSSEGVYMRFGSSSRRVGPELLDDLFRHINNLSFDQLPCADLEMDDLDQSKLAAFFDQLSNKKQDIGTLKSLGVLTTLSGKSVPSNGGIILFGKDEARERFFPDARISCARFKGIDKSRFIDRQDIEESLVNSLNSVLKFIARNTRLGGIIRSLKREDIPEYPEIPVREVLVNAIVHANYAVPGRLFVAIYDDRLEIQSPGMFPYGITLEDFKSGFSHIRNRVFARVFRELHHMEEWGSGYHRIVGYCQEFGYPIPEWQEFGSAVRVIFRPHESFQE